MSRIALRLPLGEREALLQRVPRRLRRRVDARMSCDHLVDVVDRDLEPFEDVLALERLVEVELRAPHHHHVAVVDEVQRASPCSGITLRHAVDQRQHDRAERGLHLRVLVELVQRRCAASRRA